ncbi:MAG: site-specific integrase [Solobacterium sp.]|nr:site-specific integrase [Solobacterium sp.]
MTKKNSEKKIFKKTPKYIREVINSAGTHALRIEIRKNDQVYRETIKISDFPTPSDALRFAEKEVNKKLRSIDIGYTVSRSSYTVLDLYEASYEVIPQRMKTKEKYDMHFRTGIKEYSDYKITDIKREHVQKSINEYAKTHSKRETQGLLTTWKRVFKTAIIKELEIIDRSAYITIPDCAEPKARTKTISQEDLEAFLEVLKDYQQSSVPLSYRSKVIYYLIQIMRYTGIRPSEGLALRKTDIDIGNRLLTINKAVRSSNDTVTSIGKTKTEKSKREVPIPEQLVPILKELLSWSKNEFVLADYYGNVFKITEISLTVNCVSKIAKIPFNLYCLRHNFSSDLFSSGTNPTVIRDLMGHTSQAMSLDYSVSKMEDRVKAINERNLS